MACWPLGRMASQGAGGWAEAPPARRAAVLAHGPRTLRAIAASTVAPTRLPPCLMAPASTLQLSGTQHPTGLLYHAMWSHQSTCGLLRQTSTPLGCSVAPGPCKSSPCLVAPTPHWAIERHKAHVAYPLRSPAPHMGCCSVRCGSTNRPSTPLGCSVAHVPSKSSSSPHGPSTPLSCGNPVARNRPNAPL